MLKKYHYGINGKLEAITKIDRVGRVVIPKEIRERMELKEDTSLLISETERGVLILKKLDIEEMAKRLRQELKGVDIESLTKRIEVESNERARKEHDPLVDTNHFVAATLEAIGTKKSGVELLTRKYPQRKQRIRKRD